MVKIEVMKRGEPQIEASGSSREILLDLVDVHVATLITLEKIAPEDLKDKIDDVYTCITDQALWVYNNAERDERTSHRMTFTGKLGDLT